MKVAAISERLLSLALVTRGSQPTRLEHNDMSVEVLQNGRSQRGPKQVAEVPAVSPRHIRAVRTVRATGQAVQRLRPDEAVNLGPRAESVTDNIERTGAAMSTMCRIAAGTSQSTCILLHRPVFDP